MDRIEQQIELHERITELLNNNPLPDNHDGGWMGEEVEAHANHFEWEEQESFITLPEHREQAMELPISVMDEEAWSPAQPEKELNRPLSPFSCSICYEDDVLPEDGFLFGLCLHQFCVEVGTRLDVAGPPSNPKISV